MILATPTIKNRASFTKNINFDLNNLETIDKSKLRFITLLRVAEKELTETGFTKFKLENIAHKSLYSRGTVYSLFKNKDKLIFQLALNTYSFWASLFQKTLELNINSKEKLLSLQISAIITSSLYPSGFSSIFYVNSHYFQRNLNTADKASFELHSDFFISSIKNLITDAVKNDELEIYHGTKNKDVALVIWSLIFGHHFLIDNKKLKKTKIISSFFEGVLLWKEDKDDISFNYKKATKNMLKDIYNAEYKKILEENPKFKVLIQ